MSRPDNRRGSTGLADRLPTIEHFAAFVQEAAAGLRTDLAGHAVSQFLSAYLHYGILTVALNRPWKGFPYIDMRCRDRDLTAQWLYGLIPQIQGRWREIADSELMMSPGIDYPDDEEMGALSVSLPSVAMEPMRFGDELLGMLVVGSRREGDFGDPERSLLRVAAGQMALVIYNDLLFETSEAINQEILETQEKLHDLSLLARYSSAAIVGFERINNRATDVVSWNEGARKLFGYRSNEMEYIPNALDRLLPDASECDEIEAPWRWDEPTTVSKETTLQAKDGRRIEALATVVTLPEVTGEAERCLAIFEDITEIKEANRALERKNQELERFARVVSHDLKNPLALIGGYAELILDTVGAELPAESREHLGTIQDQTRKMSDFVGALLQFSRTGQTEPSFSEFSMDRVVQNALAELAFQLHDVGAGVDVTQNLPVVRADETRITQVWRNLLGNAVKYRDPQRPLHIRIEAQALEDGSWSFFVGDNGMGIAAEAQDQIFDLYQRANVKREDGTGIGLALVKRIVEQHGGRVEVDSRPGEGSTFMFSLPGVQERGER